MFEVLTHTRTDTHMHANTHTQIEILSDFPPLSLAKLIELKHKSHCLDLHGSRIMIIILDTQKNVQIYCFPTHV